MVQRTKAQSLEETLVWYWVAPQDDRFSLVARECGPRNCNKLLATFSVKKASAFRITLQAGSCEAEGAWVFVEAAGPGLTEQRPDDGKRYTTLNHQILQH